MCKLDATLTIPSLSVSLMQKTGNEPLYDSENERLLDVDEVELFARTLGIPLNVTLSCSIGG